jgi:hypothetical protein
MFRFLDKVKHDRLFEECELIVFFRGGECQEDCEKLFLSVY